MRLLEVSCILLACIATTLAANETNIEETLRPKRHLQFWKDILAAKLKLLSPAAPIQDNENVKLLRIPGFERVIVKAVPKVTVIETPVPVPERIVPLDPTMALLGAYLGTKTPEETLIALQRVKGLIQSGIVKAREEVIEVMPPKPPVFVFPEMTGKVMYSEPRPVFHVAPKIPVVPVPMMPVPAVRPLPVHMFPAPMPAVGPLSVLLYPEPVPALRPLPIPAYPAPAGRPLPVPVYHPRMPVVRPLPIPKMVIDEMRPVPVSPIVPIDLVPTKYSYKQLHGGSVMSFDSLGGQDVIVTKTNKPLPPPPRYIIDRFQKMIFGLPLGVPIMPPQILPVSPAPAFVRRPSVVSVGLYPPPVPIIPRPSIVTVKSYKPLKKLNKGSVHIFGGTMMKNPFTSKLVHEQIVVPKPVAVDVSPVVVPAPAVLVDAKKPEDSDLAYKHVHGDGTMSIYEGSAVIEEPIITVEDISKLPPPPPEILHRIEDAAAKAHHPKSMWGYTFKIANGIGYYETTNKDKIFYSRLLSGGDKHGFPAVPDPLSSKNDEEKDKRKHKNIIVLEEKLNEGKGDQDMTDKNNLGDPFLSTKINVSEVLTTTTEASSEIPSTTKVSPVKKLPPLPAPIVGENKNADHHKVSGASGYSYTLLKNDGLHLRIGGIANEPGDSMKKVHGSGTFSYTQIEGGKVTNILKDKPSGAVLVTERVKNIPILPSAIVDVPVGRFEPVGGVVKVSESHPGIIFPKPVVSTYNYKQVNHNNPKQPFTVVKIAPSPGPVLVKESIKTVPGLPSAIIDVPIGRIEPVRAVKFQENRPGIVFPKPVVSSYMYKQVSHNNPKQPFTVVQVGDQSRFEVPKGDVHVKIHEHMRADGTKYPCSEVHMVPVAPAPVAVPVAPIPVVPTVGLSSTVPGSLVYVPPSTIDVPIPTRHKEVKKPESHYSYTQVTNKGNKQVTAKPTTSTTTEKHLSLSLNPIVVAPEESNYSYTSINSDGSSVNIRGNKDNTVTVKVEDSNGNSYDGHRGDIPESLA